MFVNKSGVDSKTGIRKTGWAPFGIALVLYMLYNRAEKRLNILPTYIMDGVFIALVYKGLINGKGFKF